MSLKLAMVGRISYYFCGRIALSTKNTKTSPVLVEVSTLTDQEAIGLLRAINTGVVTALEGLEDLKERVEVSETSRKVKREKKLAEALEQANEPIPVITEEVKVEETLELPEVIEEVVEQPIEEVVVTKEAEVEEKPTEDVEKVEEVVETSSDTVAKPAPRRTRSKK